MKCVLIVEDNIDVAHMLSTLLRLNGAGVEVKLHTDDFAAVMDVQRWDGIDVGVIDLMLPKVSGVTILRWMADNVPTVRRVVYSATAESVDRKLADAVLNKTADYRTIVAALGLN